MTSSHRPYYFLLFFVCHELLITALYFEIYLGLDPCPLCMLSRLVVFIMGTGFLMAALHNPHGMIRKIYHTFFSFFAFLGLLISGQHIYIQSLPADEVPSCGPSLDYMLDTLPMSEVIREIMQGSGECAEVSWRFLSLSMPVWMLLIYLAFFVLALTPFFKQGRILPE